MLDGEARSAKRKEKRSVRGWDVKVNEKKGRGAKERGGVRPLESGRETIWNEGVGEPGRETRHRHPFHPLPIRHHPVMELQIRRHYMPLGNLWFRAQFHASTRPVTSLQPPLIPLTTLSLSLFLATLTAPLYPLFSRSVSYTRSTNHKDSN